MREITTREDLEALPERSIIVLVDREWGARQTSIYQRFSTEWIEMDPTDRDDGERGWRSADLWAIATVRNGGEGVPYLIFDPRDLPTVEL